MPKVDLAYTDEEMKEHAKCCDMPEDYKGPKYPWGLSLQLEDAVLKKLGKSASDFKLGELMDLPVTVRVTGMDARENDDGSMRQSVSLVVTAIDVPSTEPEKAAKLYES